MSDLSEILNNLKAMNERMQADIGLPKNPEFVGSPAMIDAIIRHFMIPDPQIEGECNLGAVATKLHLEEFERRFGVSLKPTQTTPSIFAGKLSDSDAT